MKVFGLCTTSKATTGSFAEALLSVGNERLECTEDVRQQLSDGRRRSHSRNFLQRRSNRKKRAYRENEKNDMDTTRR